MMGSVEQGVSHIMRTRCLTFTGSYIPGSFSGCMISAGAHVGGNAGASFTCVTKNTVEHDI